ncbi:MAG TPA: hypothetical protein VN429_03310, partial [Methanospirillum sp.]|nr:hypothetical protein [Methanospirillum sp.]
MRIMCYAILLVFWIGLSPGIVSGAVPQLQTYEIPGELSMLLPYGWSVTNFQCWGISIINPDNPCYGIMFLSKLHQYPNLLPRGTTPEQYVNEYFASDLKLGGKKASAVQILNSGDTEIPALNAVGSVNAKSMKVALQIENVPVTAYLTVGTYDDIFGTAIAYLWGFYGPTESIGVDGVPMKKVFDSIRYDNDYLNECNRLS